MASSNTPQGVDNTFRKKFDTEEYRERAREREKKEAERSKQSKGPPVQRAPLKHRDYHVDLESRLGKTQPQGVDNTFRKKFDTEEYRERAREREKKEAERSKQSKGPPVQRAPLKHRDYHVDLESRLGKTQVVTPVAPLSQQAGYFCRVCDCVVKDSANYLDHINGKKHQRALGMSMRVERSSLEQVQERFEVLKKRKTPGTFSEQDLDERIRKQQEEEEEYKRQRREKKKEKKKGKVVEEEPEMDPEVAEMMGFGGFGSSKKS